MDSTEERMRKIAELVAQLVPGYGFAVVVFAKEDGEGVNYVSNCSRQEVVAELRVCAAQIERNASPSVH